MEVNKIISQNIAKYRKNKGLSQSDIARMLGVSPQAVSKWENALCCPDISLLPLISNICGVTIDDLFSEQ
ncbi:MAG: helix-turn-helix transcriptional regulator [Clostridiales bacterium]|nr:helix-turn-helix transcriptional regulator [Clostridiales bacterium]